MTISPEEQVWTVVEAIANSHEIMPSGGNLLLNPKKLAKTISGIELRQILTKLEQDERILKIKSRPSDFQLDEEDGCYDLVIKNYEKFREFLNKAHTRHHGSIEMLTGDNFLSVVDVAADIYSGLQMRANSTTTIPLLQTTVRFPSLLPVHAVSAFDRNSQLRWNATLYLKERGHIEDYKLNRNEFSRWDQTITVTVDRVKFTTFYERLMTVYKKRVRFESEGTKKKVEATILEPPVQKMEITAMPEIQVRNSENSNPMKGKKETAYITKTNDDFHYKGRYVNLSKKADYYKVFCALYAKLPEGGEVSYKDLGDEIKSRIPKTENKTNEEMQKYIQRNLTDKSNGFMRYAGIPETEDNGKPLIEVVRGSGVTFNNKTG